MNFTTSIPIPKSNNPIDYNSQIVSFGSCFAENMAEKFDYFKFKNKVNPFGIIFNPISIEKLISRIVNNQEFTEKDIFFHNELWQCYDVHSDLSHEDKEEFIQNLNGILKSTNDQITKSTHIIITYGTSWIYKLKSSNEVVANCHKVPQNQFIKEILAVEIIEKAIQKTIDLINKVNPNCNIIFTISPVRHIKDGFIENQRSKSHLIVALQSLLRTVHCPEASGLNTNYFPSYEIIMDELRDYRFYTEDMLHPNQTAINYIWERFSETQISDKIHLIMQEVGSIQKSILHKSFHPNSESHQKFLANLNQKINTLATQFPNIQF